MRPNKVENISNVKIAYRTPRWVFLIGVFLLCVLPSMLFVLEQASKTITSDYAPLIADVKEVRVKVTEAHLFLEEILAGDSSESIDQVLADIGMAIDIIDYLHQFNMLLIINLPFICIFTTIVYNFTIFIR